MLVSRMLARVRRLSLRWRLLLLVVVAVGPAFALIVVAAEVQRREGRAVAETELWRVRDLIAANQQARIDDTHQLLGALQLIPAIAHQEADCTTILADLRAAHPEYLDLGVALPDGGIACATTSPAALPQTRPRWLERAVSTGRFAIGDYELDAATGRPTLILAQPVRDGDRVSAVVFAALDLGSLRRLGAVSALSADAEVLLARGDGLVLARHPDPDGTWASRRSPDAPVVAAMRRIGNGAAIADSIDRVRRLWVFRPVSPGVDTWLAVGLELGAVYRPSERSRQRNLVVMGLVAAITLALAWFGTRATLRPLEALVRRAQEQAGDHVVARAEPPRGAAEIVRMTVAFDNMSSAVAQREERLRETAQALERRTEDLNRLMEHQTAVREEEATQIAREVHDVIGQALTALKMDVSWLNRHIADVATTAGRDGLTARLAEARALIDSTIDTVRRIAVTLRPSVLDDLGLAAAIEWQAQELATRAGLRCHLEIDPEVELSPRPATAMFRIFQEIGANIARHAQASEIAVRLERTDDRVVLAVTDDGVGIPPRAIEDRRSLGLLGMRERAILCGGTVGFKNGIARGTIVTVTMPTGTA